MPSKFNRILQLSGCLLFTSLIIAQDTYLDEVMLGYRQDRVLRINYEQLQDPSLASVHMSRLIDYTLDSQSFIRQMAYRLLGHIDQHTASPDLRITVLDRFSYCLDDPVPMVREQCVTQLKRFPDSLFTPSQRQIILEHALRYADPEAIKLAGYLRADGAVEGIKRLAGDPDVSRESRIAARMALARMGDPDELDYFDRIIRKVAINDDHLMAIGELAAYVRAKPITDQLLQVILDDQLNCTSTDPDRDQPILCAYRAMEYVAGIIRDFPIVVRPSGDLDTDDYSQALRIVRQWIRSHPEYQIATNVY